MYLSHKAYTNIAFLHEQMNRRRNMTQSMNYQIYEIHRHDVLRINKLSVLKIDKLGLQKLRI